MFEDHVCDECGSDISLDDAAEGFTKHCRRCCEDEPSGECDECGAEISADDVWEGFTKHCRACCEDEDADF